ncbi:hypothetical protein [Candidatus Endomicrobiellum pyrsonymphae]|uniref:hypothetical protein n=1 Tax=Candidatus Endomicrobiellum pyrsonymphae TaxID=1408203 RepID=UPI0035A9102B
MNDKGKTDLIKSIKTFNLAEIPVINLDNQILAGHMRIAILIELGRGDELIDVRVPNKQLSKKEADEYLLRSNKNTGEWDINILGKMFNFDFLKEVGFNDFELDKIFERFLKEEGEEFNAGKEYENIREPRTKKGEIYILGAHRLMCGSCADEKDFERLMDGQKGNLIFTDPPYNVDYKSSAGYSYDSKKFGGTD